MASTGEVTTLAPQWRSPLLVRATFVVAWLLGAWLALLALNGVTAGNLGSDAHPYWLTGQAGGLSYNLPPGTRDAYLYSPAFAQIIRPLTFLPWPVFLGTWVAAGTLALLWLVKPLPLRWAAPIFLLCVPELVVGNIHLLLAVVVVLGFRAPAAWVGAVLTKLTPGVGVLWFVARREWRSVLWAMGATVAVAGASYLLDPAAWHRWLALLLSHSDGARDGRLLMLVRYGLAALVATYAGRTGRAWLLPVAMLFALPVLAIPSLAVGAAIPRLLAGGEGAGGDQARGCAAVPSHQPSTVSG